MGDFTQDEASQLVAVGDALRHSGDAAGAVERYRAALAIDPNHYEACINLGVISLLSGQVVAAIGLLRRAVETQPTRALGWLNLGNAVMQAGDIKDAVSACRRALELKSDLETAGRNLAFFLTFDPESSPQAILDEHRRWACQYADQLLGTLQHANDRSPSRRLKVGYVSPDFREHAVAHFVEPLLRNHNLREVEVFCFSDVARPDQITQRFRGLVNHWHHTSQTADEELAATIRALQIDIIVDLAGFTNGGRPLLFARKPAPVQMAYLGYPNTTGIKAIDYRIVDPHTDPPGMTDQLWTEQLIRLPRTFACYQPPTHAGEVNDLPAASNGFITFGSFAMLSKLNDPLIAAWCRIIHDVPRSRLFIATGGLQESELAERIRQRFAVHGIEPSRLELRGALKFEEYMMAHRRIDILLDTFPVNGHTISCHALWMGVPIVSLAGTSYRERLGASLLNNLGLAELLAQTTDQYVQVVVDLASDLPRLRALRSSLRQRMTTSPLCDAKGFASDIETAYRMAWKHWCTTR